MTGIGVHEAKTHFSTLLRRVAAGEEIVILNGGEPVARLVPFAPRGTRRLGVDQGEFVVPDDFDAPLPDAIVSNFR